MVDLECFTSRAGTQYENTIPLFHVALPRALKRKTFKKWNHIIMASSKKDWRRQAARNEGFGAAKQKERLKGFVKGFLNKKKSH